MATRNDKGASVISEGDGPRTTSRTDTGHAEAREKFGGTNLGASFFGWIVAIGVSAILTGIIGAVGTAVGFNGNLTQSTAQREAGTIGIASAIVLIVVLLVGYYAG